MFEPEDDPTIHLHNPIMGLTESSGDTEGAEELEGGEEEPPEDVNPPSDGEPPEDRKKRSKKELSSTELFRLYRCYIEHQDHLTNQRLYRLFIAHASLVAGLCVVISRSSSELIRQYLPMILMILAMFSVVLCIVQIFAIGASLGAIKTLAEQWDEIEPSLSCREFLPGIIGGGQSTKNRKIRGWNIGVGRKTSLAAPFLFAMFWLLVFCAGYVLKSNPNAFENVQPESNKSVPTVCVPQLDAIHPESRSPAIHPLASKSQNQRN